MVWVPTRADVIAIGWAMLITGVLWGALEWYFGREEERDGRDKVD